MRVKIGPVEYEIKYEKLNGALGELNFQTAVIKIDDTDMPAQVKRLTLCHEIAHPMLKAIMKTEDDNDPAAETLGLFLLQFIQDNPEVVRFLQNEGEEE